MKKKIHYYTFLLLSLLLLQNCTNIELPYSIQARYVDNAAFRSGACDFGVQVHRATLPDGLITGRDTFLVAGFSTSWEPGAPPVGCDHLFIWRNVSLFSFDITSLLNLGYNSDRLSRACLELNFDLGVTPRFEVTPARPWGWNGGVLGESGPPRDYSKFTLKAVTEPWTPDNMDDEIQLRRERIPSIQNIQTLVSNPIFDISPNRSVISIDVTDEIRTMIIQHAMNSETVTVTGFALMHAGDDHIFQHTNIAMAAFKPSLKLSFKN